MRKPPRKKLHYWTVKEKQAVVHSMQKGLKPSEIRLKYFKGDRTLNNPAVAAMMSKLKRNPSYADVPANYPGGKVPVAKTLVGGKHVEVKTKKSSKRKTVAKTTEAVSPSVKKSVDKKPVSPQPVQLSIDFTGKADELIQKFKMKTDLFKDEFTTLCDLVKESNFSEKAKQRLVEAITEVSELEFRFEQNELAKSLKS